MTDRVRRQLAYAVILCLAGAGLALYAATRTWLVDVTVRPAPLPALRDARTGGDLVSWLPGLAVVGLAGGGALLATRGAARRGVGVLLGLAGVGIAGGAAVAVIDGAAPGWPVLCAVGAAAVAAGGVSAVLRGGAWPALGARYDRRAPAPTGEPTRSDPAPDGKPPAGGTVAAWDALDRGEDPTAG